MRMALAASVAMLGCTGPSQPTTSQLKSQPAETAGAPDSTVVADPRAMKKGQPPAPRASAAANAPDGMSSLTWDMGGASFGRQGPGYRLQQIASPCPPPLPTNPPDEPGIREVFDPNGLPVKCETLLSRYFWYYYPAPLPTEARPFLTYRLMLHTDFIFCPFEEELHGDSQNDITRMCLVTWPWPAGSSTPTPSGTPSVSPTSTPIATPTPIPDPALHVDHLSISPGMGLGQDETAIHVTAAAGWTLTLSGDGQPTKAIVAPGSGKADFNWGGTYADGSLVPAGEYNLTLNDSATGSVLHVPIAIHRPLKFTGAEPKAFSPNGDGSKDSYALDVVSSGAWTISVDGRPGPIDTGSGPNFGNKSFPWDGKVNGITLPDGKYTLRLKAGTEEKTVEVIIDRVKPVLRDVRVLKIAQTSVGEPLTYWFGADLPDVPENTNGSAIDDDATTLDGANVAWTRQQGRTNLDDRVTYVEVTLPQTFIENLRYTLIVRDKAGNQAKVKANMSLGANYSGEVVTTSGSCPTAGHYQLMATGKPQTLPDLLQASLNQACAMPLTSGANNPDFFYVRNRRQPPEQGHIPDEIDKEDAHSNFNFEYVIAGGLSDLKGSGERLAKKLVAFKYGITIPEAIQFVHVDRINGVDVPQGQPWLTTEVSSLQEGAYSSKIVWNGRRDNLETDGPALIAPMGDYRVRHVYPGGAGIAGIRFDIEPERDHLDGFRVVNRFSGFVNGFNTFETFKSATHYGGVGRNFAWHHIVEKEKVFPAQSLHNIGNLVRLTEPEHTLVSRFYSSRKDRRPKTSRPLKVDTGDMTLRSWLNGRPYNEQHDIGVHVMDILGIDVKAARQY